MARIKVRKQSGLLVDRARGLREIRQGRAMSQARELIGGGSVAQLRLVAEREQRLLAACGTTRPRNGKRFVEGQIRPLVLTRRMSKRAVMTNVAAKLGQRNKNLARIRDDGAVGGVAPAGGRAHERGKVAVHERERFLAGEIAVEIVGQNCSSVHPAFTAAAMLVFR